MTENKSLTEPETEAEVDQGTDVVPRPFVSSELRGNDVKSPEFNDKIAETSEEELDEDLPDESASGADTDVLSRLQEVQATLHQGIEQLQEAFDAKIKYDKSKNQVIDALHRELQDYRDDLHFKIMRPVFRDLITMYDDMANVLRHAPESEDEEVLRMQRTLAGFQDTIEDILYRHGVESYEEDGDAFIRQRQRALKAVTTAEPELDGKVSERLRRGFVYEDKVLRPELVTIYKYREATE